MNPKVHRSASILSFFSPPAGSLPFNYHEMITEIALALSFQGTYRWLRKELPMRMVVTPLTHKSSRKCATLHYITAFTLLLADPEVPIVTRNAAAFNVTMTNTSIVPGWNFVPLSLNTQLQWHACMPFQPLNFQGTRSCSPATIFFDIISHTHRWVQLFL